MSKGKRIYYARLEQNWRLRLEEREQVRRRRRDRKAEEEFDRRLYAKSKTEV